MFRSNNRASVLLMTMMFLGVLALLTVVFLNSISKNVTNSNVQANMVQALYLAEAGVNKAIYYLNNTAPDGTKDGSWRTTPYPAAAGNTLPAACSTSPTAPCQEAVTVNGDSTSYTYTFWIETSGNNLKITSTGNYNGVNRTIQVITTQRRGLIAYMKLDDGSSGSTPTTAADSSGNGYTHTLTSPVWTSAGKFSNAWTVAPSSQTTSYLNSNIKALYGASQFSISFWLKRPNNAFFQNLIYIYGNNWISYMVINDSTVTIYIMNNVTDAWDAYEAFSTSGSVSVNGWNHYVLIYDGTQSVNQDRLKVYLNNTAKSGSLSGTLSSSTYVSSGNLNLYYIQQSSWGTTTIIDDYRIYNRALSAAEIAALYNGTQDITLDTKSGISVISWKECSQTAICT